MKFKTRENQEQSNFQSNKVIQAKIGNPAKMLKMFTKDLYKHPLQTAIQEYINNARDAHIMADKDTADIKITAPTVANQNVIIQDFGPGLSVDEVENIFASIAMSNKDNSDKFNGGFGIGSKSWFAVNTSFMVISVHDNKKTYYSVTFDESKGIFIHEDAVEETLEPNGVTVHLPLANESQIEDAHRAIFRAVEFWEVKPELINCNYDFYPIKFENEDYTLISDDIDSEPRIVVTLGRTPYSIKELPCVYDLKQKFKYLNVAIHFKVGEMGLKNQQEVGPDREAFMKVCSDYIAKKGDKVYNQIVKKLEEKLEEADKKEKILEYLSNPILSQKYFQEGYEKEIIKDCVVVFRPPRYGKKPEEVGIKMRGKVADWVCVEGKATQAETYLNNTRRVTNIIVNDKPKMKKTELRLAMSEAVPSVARPYNRNGIIWKGAYMVEESNYTKKELKALSEFFEVEYLSKIEFEKPERTKREKAKINKDEFNMMKSSAHEICNITQKFSELDKEKVVYCTRAEWDKVKNDFSWSTAKKAYRELGIQIIHVAQSNADKLKAFKFKKLDHKKILKALEEKQKQKLVELRKEFEASDLKERMMYESLVKYLNNKCGYGYNNIGYASVQEKLRKLDVKHEGLRAFANFKIPEVGNIYGDQRKYRAVLKPDDLKVKEENVHLPMLRTLERENPVLFKLLFDRTWRGGSRYDKELKILLDSISS